MTTDALGVAKPHLLALVQVLARVVRFPAGGESIGPSDGTSEKNKDHGDDASELVWDKHHGSSLERQNGTLCIYAFSERKCTLSPFQLLGLIRQPSWLLRTPARKQTRTLVTAAFGRSPAAGQSFPANVPRLDVRSTLLAAPRPRSNIPALRSGDIHHVSRRNRALRSRAKPLR